MFAETHLEKGELVELVWVLVLHVAGLKSVVLSPIWCQNQLQVSLAAASPVHLG